MRLQIIWPAMMALGLLAGCGGLEVPAGGGGLLWGPGGNGSSVGSRQASDQNFVQANAVKVGRGDTVYALSRRHGVSPRAIIEVNNLRAPYHLNVGQRIVLPRPKVHVVQSGDTLYSISRTYGTDTFTLAKLNNLSKPFRILVNDRLVIPTGAKAAPVKPSGSVQTASSLPTKRVTPTRKPQPAVHVPPPPARSGRFQWPVRGKVVSSFGAKKGGYHNDGINILADRGSAVMAAENGVVVYAGNELRGFGNLLLIKHADGYVTAYAHNDSILVKKGDKVRKGGKIATVGSTGSVTTPQLHFEVRKGRQARDPKKYLS